MQIGNCRLKIANWPDLAKPQFSIRNSQPAICSLFLPTSDLRLRTSLFCGAWPPIPHPWALAPRLFESLAWCRRPEHNSTVGGWNGAGRILHPAWRKQLPSTLRLGAFARDIGHRNEIESVNRPVVVGGTLVMPGDVIVADGDGVIVVPRRCAREVAQHAQKILEGDKAGRRAKYEQLGLPLDDSVK